MNVPSTVIINEVGPRDGLQNERHFVDTKDKINLIKQLVKSGLKNIEVTSFVSTHAVPQLSDAEHVYRAIQGISNCNFSVLIPNLLGMQRALACNIKNIAIFTAASETFNKRNINCSIRESLQRFELIMPLAKKFGINVRAYISCALGCPYEGTVSPKIVANIISKLIDLGVSEVCLGDTVGVGTPKQTQKVIDVALQNIAIENLAMHFHDTYGQGIANIYAALELGISKFDSSVAGLGGCPYAMGATGNVATEDVLYLMHGLGIDTGVDIYQVIKAGQQICKVLQKPNQSKVARALLAHK